MCAFFQARPDTVVEQVSETELEVSLLGSFNPAAHEHEIERLLRAVPGRGESPARPEAERSLTGDLGWLLRRSRLRVLDGGEASLDDE